MTSRNTTLLASSSKQQSPLSEFFSLLKLWVQPHKKYVMGACIALTSAAGSVLALGGVVRHLVDQGLSQLNESELHATLLQFMAVASILALSSAARFYFTASLGKRLLRQLRLQLFKKVLNSTLEERPNWSTESIQSIEQDLNTLEQWISSQFSVSLRNVLLVLGGIGLLIHSSAKLALLFLVIIPALILPILILTKRFRTRVKAQTLENETLATFFDEHLRGLPVIQSLNYEDEALKKLETRSQSLQNTQTASLRGRASLVASIMFVVFAGIAFILWTGGHDVLQGTMSKGTLSAFILYAMMVAGALGALSDASEELRRVSQATLRLHSWLLLPDHSTPLNTASSITPSPDSLHGAMILFDSVSFKYPNRLHYVLHQFSLSIQAGEHVAIVGASGAGKSTLFQLLLGFYPASIGKISIMNTPINLNNAPVLRHYMAWVSQDPILFSGSIRDNLLYGNPSATDNDLNQVCKAANLEQWIYSLSEGLDTLVGNLNLGVSGGQRQRIAIARAMLANRPILLLDEATSALDAENEHTIQEALDRLSAGRTVITIAHRLSTIQSAHRIVLMDQGSIVDIGTHLELLARQELYQRFVSLQTLEAI
jgi:ATP-binding cassette, subfamily B, bacterial